MSRIVFTMLPLFDVNRRSVPDTLLLPVRIRDDGSVVHMPPVVVEGRPVGQGDLDAVVEEAKEGGK
jgi:hypothetical protein